MGDGLFTFVCFICVYLHNNQTLISTTCVQPLCPPCMIATFLIINAWNEQCYISDDMINVIMHIGRMWFRNNDIVYIVDLGYQIQLQKHLCSIHVQVSPTSQLQTNTQYVQHHRCCMQACGHDTNRIPIVIHMSGNIECITVSRLLVLCPVDDVDHIFASIFIYIHRTQTIQETVRGIYG